MSVTLGEKVFVCIYFSHLSIAIYDCHLKTYYIICAEKHILSPPFLDTVKKVENSPILSIAFFY